MKKLFAFAIAFALTFGLIVFAAPDSGEVQVTVDGEYVEFQDQDPVIIDGRTLVPVRGVFEALGFEVGWDSTSRTVLMWRADYFLQIRIDQYIFTTNGEEFELDVPAQIINGRTLVPIRFPLESIGVFIDWREDERMVIVDTEYATEGIYQWESLEVTPMPGITPQPTPGGPGATPTPTPTRTPTPTPPRSPTPGPNPTASPTPTATPTRPSTQFPSSITLQNRRLTESERQNWINDYYNQGGPSTFENQVVNLINQERTKYGLNTLTVDPALMRAARYYTQIMNDLNTGLGHNKGPYATNPSATHGASRNVVETFGGRINFNGGNGAFGHSTAVAVVGRVNPDRDDCNQNGWMGSRGHRNFILHSDHLFIGVGRFGSLTYMFLSNQSNMTPTPSPSPSPTPTPPVTSPSALGFQLP
ncbi:MAG: stalk domain-containing protein [Defluviitaleaceae bacterium]|nr:stalk domain-containing protein [Defluviitaleaceae bacterium]